MKIYNGNVTTDENGEAVVTLPDYFEALNRDFRYQLTVIGQFAQAIVAEKIKGNQFKIRTDKPNVEVSWQVTGIWQDKFAEDKRIPIEEAKPIQECVNVCTIRLVAKSSSRNKIGSIKSAASAAPELIDTACRTLN